MAFVYGVPNNAFCKLERGEIVLSEVRIKYCPLR